MPECRRTVECGPYRTVQCGRERGHEGGCHEDGGCQAAESFEPGWVRRCGRRRGTGLYALAGGLLAVALCPAHAALAGARLGAELQKTPYEKGGGAMGTKDKKAGAAGAEGA